MAIARSNDLNERRSVVAKYAQEKTMEIINIVSLCISVIALCIAISTLRSDI
jgi:hypothetical protein